MQFYALCLSFCIIFAPYMCIYVYMCVYVLKATEVVLKAVNACLGLYTFTTILHMYMYMHICIHTYIHTQAHTTNCRYLKVAYRCAISPYTWYQEEVQALLRSRGHFEIVSDPKAYGVVLQLSPYKDIQVLSVFLFLFILLSFFFFFLSVFLSVSISICISFYLSIYLSV